MTLRKSNIRRFIQCTQCAEEKPPETSFQKWGRLDVGFDGDNLIVWCSRHEMTILSTPMKIPKGMKCSCGSCGENDCQ